MSEISTEESKPLSDVSDFAELLKGMRFDSVTYSSEPAKEASMGFEEAVHQINYDLYAAALAGPELVVDNSQSAESKVAELLEKLENDLEFEQYRDTMVLALRAMLNGQLSIDKIDDMVSQISSAADYYTLNKAFEAVVNQIPNALANHWGEALDKIEDGIAEREELERRRRDFAAELAERYGKDADTAIGLLDDIANAETPEDKAKAAAIYRIWATGKGVSDDTIDNDISTVIDLSGVKAVRNVNEVTPENVATIVASSREEALKLAAAKPSEGNRQASVPEQNAVVASADDLFAGIVTQHPAEIVQPSQTVTPVTYEVASADDLFADFGQLTPNTPNADGASKDNTRILT